MSNIITQDAIERRSHWVSEIKSISGNFSDDYLRLETEIGSELNRYGIPALIDHIRLCGDIPEAYRHDSSEEKLYSKYTDLLLSLAFKAMGLSSLVLTERADAADVEVVGDSYSFVADAKAFRLSRTAKNQKDFKIQAMDMWKRGKPYAMVVCPIYQLPATSSQIYLQSITRNVCIFTYSHLAVLLNFLQIEGESQTQGLLAGIFGVIPTLTPSKSAVSYWTAINRSMLDYSPRIDELWRIEKQAASEAVEIAKNEDLTFLAQQRESIMRMSHEEAIAELIKVHKIDSKIRTISSVRDSGLFTIV